MLAGLSCETIGFLWLGALVGGIAAGGTGFAFGLAASSIWLHYIDPLQSGILVAGCGLLLHLTTIWQQRQHVEPARIWPFVVGGLFGVPIGVHFLAYTDAASLKIVLAVFLIVFGTYAFLAPKLATVTGGGRPADVSIGFLGGVLGGLGGYSGVLPTIWTQLRGWPKETARAVYQPYVIVMIERPCFPECRSGWPDPIPGDLRAVLRSSVCYRVYGVRFSPALLGVAVNRI